MESGSYSRTIADIVGNSAAIFSSILDTEPRNNPIAYNAIEINWRIEQAIVLARFKFLKILSAYRSYRLSILRRRTTIGNRRGLNVKT